MFHRQAINQQQSHRHQTLFKVICRMHYSTESTEFSNVLHKIYNHSYQIIMFIYFWFKFITFHILTISPLPKPVNSTDAGTLAIQLWILLQLLLPEHRGAFICHLIRFGDEENARLFILSVSNMTFIELLCRSKSPLWKNHRICRWDGLVRWRWNVEFPRNV